MLAWAVPQETAGVTSLSQAAAAMPGCAVLRMPQSVGTHNDHPLDPKVLLLEQPDLHPRFLQRANNQLSRGADGAEVPRMDRLLGPSFRQPWGGGRKG